MDYLLILTIDDAAKALERSRKREKQDNCAFENMPFQSKLKPYFESAEFREIFERLGTKVVYVDVSGTEEETQKQTVTFYEEYLQ
jgi:thymidylate kinase